MYYYVAEAITTNADLKRIEEIKSLLSQLGIAGEFAIASPARTVEEHLELAFSKGFTTVVGIGSDALISKVAGTMLAKRYDKAVLGAIPFRASQTVWQMMGVKNLPEIGQALRERRLLTIDAVMLGKSQAFITNASMNLRQSTKFRLHYNQVQLLGQCTNLTIKTTGEVNLWDSSLNRGGLWRKLFGRKNESETAVTHFLADVWQFATEAPNSITVDGLEIAKTPIEVIRRPKALKLIVNRATITP